jgi:hypothetical protein
MTANRIGGAVTVYDDLRFGQERARLPAIGDTVLEINGRPFTGYGVMREAVRDARPGTVMSAVVQRRDGTTARITFELAAEGTAPAPISEWVRDVAVQLIFPLFCLVLGFLVAAARPSIEMRGCCSGL